MKDGSVNINGVCNRPGGDPEAYGLWLLTASIFTDTLK